MSPKTVQAQQTTQPLPPPPKKQNIPWEVPGVVFERFLWVLGRFVFDLLGFYFFPRPSPPTPSALSRSDLVLLRALLAPRLPANPERTSAELSGSLKNRIVVETPRSRSEIDRDRFVPVCGHRPGHFWLGFVWFWGRF